MTARKAHSLSSLLVLGALVFGLAGCDDMYDQPKFRGLRRTTLFDNDQSARPVVKGTIARGGLRDDEGFFSGKVNGKDVDTFPFPVTAAVLDRGRERFDIYCSPCHDKTGDGRGMVVLRGAKQPPSFHEERLRAAAPGHVVDVITNGFGAMYSYAARVKPKDRWAIAAYVRALQLSQNVAVADLTPKERADLQNPQPRPSAKPQQEKE